MHDVVAAALESVRCGRPREALARLAPALERDPENLAALTCAADAFYALREHRAALQAYRAVVKRNPGDMQARFREGLCLQQLGQIEDSVDVLRAVLETTSAHAVRLALGRSLLVTGEIDAAMQCFEEVLQHGRSAEAFANLGTAHYCRGRWADAVAAFEQALAIDPAFLDARRSLALLVLLRGEWDRGWALYRARWGSEGPPLPAELLALPRWDGALMPGRVLLVHEEQGLGDTIHFVRYVLTLKQLGQAVVCRCQPALRTLLARSLEGVDVVGSDDPVPAAHARIALTDLPSILDPQLAEIPARDGYLVSAVPSVELDASLADSTGLRVGLFWWGNQTNLLGRHRSCAFEHLEPLLRVPGITWFSLQHQDGLDVAQRFPWARELRVLGRRIDGFEDLAAAIRKLDLVITIDTVTAHLAGALGAPTWTLLSFPPDWRWGLNGERTPWYRSMRLFRMRAHGAWPALIGEVAAELQRHAR